MLVAAVAVSVTGVLAAPASAAPAAPGTATDLARVESAVRRFEQARGRLARIEARAHRSTADLDRTLLELGAAQKRLHSRARAMYCYGPAEVVSMLLGADTFEEFTSRWDMLLVISEKEADDLRRLRELRVRAERSAKSALDLQVQQARAADALEREVARAKRDLASSQTSLARYRARTGSATSGGGAHRDSMQRLRGSGAWKTAVASHYGRSFTGRGASGERIGPYSMIVAHKSLPFGTLIEFEYKGRRAVARVADRGPNSPGRTFDLGPGVVRVLDFAGVDAVRYRLIRR